MAAVGMWLRAETRRRWRAWLALALIGGLAAGVATAAAAGARRADSAYPRLLRWTGAPDLFTGGTSGSDETFADEIAALEKHPLVTKSVRSYGVSDQVLAADGRPLVFPAVAAGLFPPRQANPYRLKLLRGRPPRPDRVDEASVSFALEGPGVELGDTLRVVLVDFSTDPPSKVLAPVRIVGVHVAPLEFRSVSGVGFSQLNISSGFYTKYQRFIPDDSSHLSLDIFLRGGAASFDEFTRDVSARGIHVEFPINLADHAVGVARSMRYESGALWLLAGLIGIAGLAIVGQAIGRQTYAEAETFETLRALGVSVGQLRRAMIVRAAGIGIVAAGITVIVAVALSPLTPIGTSRIAEPSPGLRLDATALAIGALAAVLLITLAQVPYAWFAARRSERGTSGQEPSRFVSLLARMGAPASAVAGAGMTTGGNPRSQAGASRAAGIAAGLGIGALVVALAFAASMHHLVDEPRLSGYAWDALLAGDIPREDLETDPRVLDYSEGSALSVEVDTFKTMAVVLDERGPLQPVIVEGRAPRGTDEIALGITAMRRLQARIGSRVPVVRALDEGEEPQTPRPRLPMTVVGRVVAPTFIFQPGEPGSSVAMTTEAARKLEVFGGQDLYFVRFGSGTDIARALYGDESERVTPNAFALPRQQAADLRSLSGIADIPLALAGVVAAIGAGALVHALVQTVRRRRRDLAILKSLGFVHHEIRSTVAWQTTTIVVAAMIVALPVGIILGRWGWRAFAEQLAVVPEPRLSILAVLLVVPATIALANLVGALPARAAARTRPALVLRTE